MNGFFTMATFSRASIFPRRLTHAATPIDSPRSCDAMILPVGITAKSAVQYVTRSLSSVSNSEVSKFSGFSKTWWDPRENPLIGMNTIRMEYIKRQTSSTKAMCNLNALDVGCGGGLLCESLARLGASVTGIDPSEALVEEAKRHSELDPRTRTIDYREGWSVETLSQKSETKFDIICLLEVIEHVADPGCILRSIRPLLKPEGKLFLSTMNRTVKSKLVAIFGAEYIMRYLPVGTHSWDRFLSPREVKSLMEGIGFDEVDVSGMTIDAPPLGGSWSWKLDPNDTDVNWIGTYQLKITNT